MNDSENGIDKLYEEYWLIHNEKLEHHDPLAIAAVLLAHAMTIYRTVLDEESYHAMVDSIDRMRDDVKKISPNQGHYH